MNEIKKTGGEAVANGDSVSDFKGAQRIIECAIDTFGKLNVVVNNAGILRDRMIFNMSEEDWDSVVAVHLKGTFACHASRLRVLARAAQGGEHPERPHHQHRVRLRSPRQPEPEQLRRGQGRRSPRSPVIIDKEMAKYGVTVNAIAPVARTRLTVEATPATAALMGQPKSRGTVRRLQPRERRSARRLARERRRRLASTARSSASAAAPCG